jgi:hypothetical protein
VSRSTIEREWEAHGLRCAVLMVELGYGPGHRCGYVMVPEGHPFHGLGYSDEAPNGTADYTDRDVDDAGMGGMIALLGGEKSVDEWAQRVEAHIAVHGGLTYSGKAPGDVQGDGWWFGFDCAHAGDEPSWWTEDRVAEEADRVAEQLAQIASVPS